MLLPLLGMAAWFMLRGTQAPAAAQRRARKPLPARIPPPSSAKSAASRTPATARRPQRTPPVLTPTKKPVTKPDPLRSLLDGTAKFKRVPAKQKARTAKPKARPVRTAPTKRQAVPAKGLVLPSFDSPESIAANALKSAVLSVQPLTKSQVAAWQRQLGGLDRDGIPGPSTRARVDEVLKQSVKWPAKIATPTGSPVPSSKALAAQDLYDYVTVFFGTRPERIKTYQSALGLTADGKVGPKTKAAVSELLGHPW